MSEPRTEVGPLAYLQWALRDLHRWDESKGWGAFNTILGRLDDAVLAIEAEAAASPADGRLREALEAADYRLGQLLGNTDADDEALRLVRKARAALESETEHE